MKTAQEFRAGQVANINGAPWVIQKAEFNKSGRNAAVVKMKLKNLLTGAGTETVFKADDKLEPIILDRKEVTYSYFADPLYVFMDSEFNQYEIEKDDLEGVLTFIEDGMTDICEAVFYNDKVISVELPTTIVRQIAYTEPAVRGDTSGKVMKTARLNNGAERRFPRSAKSATRSRSIPAPASTSPASRPDPFARRKSPAFAGLFVSASAAAESQKLQTDTFRRTSILPRVALGRGRPGGRRLPALRRLRAPGPAG